MPYLTLHYWQVPNMDQSLWVSIIGAVMSIMYSFITSES
jgi:hypothetical protein